MLKIDYNFNASLGYTFAEIRYTALIKVFLNHLHLLKCF